MGFNFKADAATAIDPKAEGEEVDPLIFQAASWVREHNKASISGIQRELKIGYNRAARLMEALEARGVVRPLQPNGKRDVLNQEND